MRTKSLLIAAAALATGIVSSSAQVYSQNVVGYVNVSLTAGTLSVVCPALDADGTGTNNTVGSVFMNPSVGDTVFAFNGSGYDILNYTVVGRGVSANTNWFLNGSADPTYALNPGRSVFYLPNVTETLTLTGNVLQGTTLTNQNVPAPGAIALVASEVPISGGLTSVLGYQPNVGDTVFIYNGSGYDIYNYTVVGRGVSANTNWFLNGSVQEPVLSVGQGFWLEPSASAPSSGWVQNFTVQ